MGDSVPTLVAMKLQQGWGTPLVRAADNLSGDTMGILRFILAVCVILGHAGFHFAVEGGTAVQCFYILSGFFMTMILTEKYNQKGQVGLYFENRFLRLFSVYWIFLGFNVALSALNHFVHHSGTLSRWIESWHHLTLIDRASLIFSNVFMIGHDWASLFELGSHGIQRVADFKSPNPFLPTLFFIPQTWTLGIEITFYILAPFLARRRWWIVMVIAVATFILRAYLVSNGYRSGMWGNGFFPSEVGMFLLGTLSYKGYAAHKDKLHGPVTLVVAGLTLLIVLAFPYIGQDGPIFFTAPHILLFTVLTVGIPALFSVTRKLKWERTIGELSYPIYLSNEIFTQTLKRIPHILSHPIFLALLTIGATTALSAVVIKFVDIPVNRYREMRLRKSRNRLAQVEAVATIPSHDAAPGDSYLRVPWTYQIRLPFQFARFKYGRAIRIAPFRLFCIHLTIKQKKRRQQWQS
jgi:peptidoglycan/LPS O-acetylase OafA/YrhL